MITMLLLGFSGSGKTTFVSSIPRALLLSFQDNGASSIIGPRADRLFVPDWQTYEKVANQLRSDARAGKRLWDTIVFDTVDEWYNILAERVVQIWNNRYNKKAESINEVGKEGRGFSDAASLLERELDSLKSVGYSWHLTGHLTEKRINKGDEPTTVVRPVLTNSAFKVVIRKAYLKCEVTPFYVRKADKVLTLPNGVEKTVKVDLNPSDWRTEFYLTIHSADALAEEESKVRLPHLPDKILLPPHGAWDVFCQCWDEAVAKCRDDNEQITQS